MFGSAWSRNQVGGSMMWASASCTIRPELYGIDFPLGLLVFDCSRVTVNGSGTASPEGPSGGRSASPAAILPFFRPWCLRDRYGGRRNAGGPGDQRQFGWSSKIHW